eukprot:1195611-Prorocentrum_minimum.AAC.3
MCNTTMYTSTLQFVQVYERVTSERVSSGNIPNRRIGFALFVNALNRRFASGEGDPGRDIPGRGGLRGTTPRAGQLGGPAFRGLRVCPGVRLRRPPVTSGYH